MQQSKSAQMARTSTYLEHREGSTLRPAFSPSAAAASRPLERLHDSRWQEVSEQAARNLRILQRQAASPLSHPPGSSSGWESRIRSLEHRAETVEKCLGDELWAVLDACCKGLEGGNGTKADALDKVWDSLQEVQANLQRHEMKLQQMPSSAESRGGDDWRKDIEWKLRQRIDEKFEVHFREAMEQSTVMCDRIEAANHSTFEHCSALEETVRQVKEDLGSTSRLQKLVEHITHRLASAEASCSTWEARVRDLEATLQSAIAEERTKRDADVGGLNEQLLKRIQSVESRIQHDVTLVEGQLADQQRKASAEIRDQVAARLTQANDRWDQLKDRLDDHATAVARQEAERLALDRRLGAVEVDADGPRRSLQRIEEELRSYRAASEHRVEATEKDLEMAVRRSADASKMAIEGSAVGQRLEKTTYELGSKHEVLAAAQSEIQRKLAEVESALEASGRQHSRASEGLAQLAEEQKSTTQVAADAASSLHKLEARLEEIVGTLGTTLRQCVEQTSAEMKDATARRFHDNDERVERLQGNLERTQLKMRSLEQTLCDRMDAADSQRSTDLETTSGQIMSRMAELETRSAHALTALETTLQHMVVKQCGESSDSMSKHLEAQIASFRDHVEHLIKNMQLQAEQSFAKHRDEAVAESRDVAKRLQRSEQSLRSDIDNHAQRLDELDRKALDLSNAVRKTSDRETSAEERAYALENRIDALSRSKAESEHKLAELNSSLLAATQQSERTTEALKRLKDEHEATTQTASGAAAALRDLDTRTAKLVKALEVAVQEQCDHLGVELQHQGHRNLVALQDRLEAVSGELRDQLASMASKLAREAEETRMAMEAGKAARKVAEDALGVAQRTEQKQKADPRPSQSDLKNALDDMEKQLSTSCTELQTSMASFAQRLEDVVSDAQRAGEEAGRSAARMSTEKAGLKAQKLEGKLAELEMKHTAFGETLRKQVERLERDTADINDGFRQRIDSAMDTTAELRTLSLTLSQQVDRMNDESKRGLSASARNQSQATDDISIVVERAEARLQDLEKRRWVATDALRQEVESSANELRIQLVSTRKQAEGAASKVARMEAQLHRTDTAVARIERQIMAQSETWAETSKAIAERADDLQAGMYEAQSDVAGILAVFSKQ
mmetsp:Transcript_20232/g.47217  ORF Transcript_20232/g.47217 Transcript_20232/m.47217 type:complete len:1139 (+) Transcript_20232:14-3430(+)